MRRFIIIFLWSGLLLFSPMLRIEQAHAFQKLIKPSVLQNATSEFRNAAGYVETQGDPLDLVGAIINAFLGLLGVIFLALIVYGGFMWMKAQGSEEDVKKAKNIITQATIGLAIVLAAYVISRFVVGALTEKTLKPAADALFSFFV